MFKHQFHIFDKAREGLNKKTQIQLIFALAAVHNFMNCHGHDIEFEAASLGEVVDSEDLNRDYSVAPVEQIDSKMISRRDEIAKQMWEDYKVYINQDR